MPKISAREMALSVLTMVEKEGAYSNLALNYVLEKYRPGKLDRAFATELAYGVLRRKNTLDWALAQLVKKPLSSLALPILNILRIGAYQLMFLDRVPASAACNESTEMAKKHGHAGVVRFVNGTLRSLARRKSEIEYPDFQKNPVKHIALLYSHPEWLVKRWLSEFGPEETISICRADNEPAPNTVRTNTLRISREELSAKLKEDGLLVRETDFAPEGLNLEGFFSYSSLNSYREGLFQVQDESSLLASRALMPGPGAKVLDSCGAPGGKTTHLAQLMENRGEILAVDLHPHKLALIEESCARLGVTIVRTLAADARSLPDSLLGWADCVLVDAPCTGLGVLRRRPDARWRKEPGQIGELVRVQAEILQSAARVLRPGGVLVYSTCTITREENAGQVENFLSARDDFTAEDLSPFLPDTLDGENTYKRGYVQILPHRHGMDGFFMARLRKKRIG